MPTSPRRVARTTRGLGRRRRTPLPTDPLESAKAANCRYVDDRGPGIRRAKRGRGFSYVSPTGSPIRELATLGRIRSLAIPPAWTDVWICADESGHIQATGRDARGRKQYRYHPRFREVREETKYERMLAFAEVLPKIRAAVDEDLGRQGLARERVLATVVRLLEITLIRVGNEEYARQNESFGLTTLRTWHVDIDGSTLQFRFRGKSGKDHVVRIRDRRLARIVGRCSDLPGEVLFQYVDDEGALRSVESADVNEYIRQIAGADFTAKDFRTWAGTVLAAHALAALPLAESEAALRRSIVQAVKDVSARLGNTPSVCRKCYVHPEVYTAYRDGELAVLATVRQVPALGERAALGLGEHEAAVLALLRRRIEGAVAKAAA
jgi:DNA topoisomerase-1